MTDETTTNTTPEAPAVSAETPKRAAKRTPAPAPIDTLDEFPPLQKAFTGTIQTDY